MSHTYQNRRASGHPAGESKKSPLRVSFDRRLKLGFHGSKITSDAGFLAYRELDDALGLTATAGEWFVDPRTGKNGQHGMAGLFRQSSFGRLGGYEDVNDADRLGHANIGLAGRGCALVADHVTEKAGEDWGQGRSPRQIRHVPIGRGWRAKKFVRENTGSD